MNKDYETVLLSTKAGTGVLGGQSTLDLIAATTKFNTTKRILEVGTAGGNYALALSDTFGSSVTAIDKNKNMADFSRERVDNYSHAGSIDVQNIDFFSEKLKSHEPFDMVTYRGLQSFVSNPDDLPKRAYELIKPWGYFVNITQTYEGETDADLVAELNSAIGANIKIEKISDLEKLYSSVGFKKVLIEQIRSTFSDESMIAPVDKALADLMKKNDQQTTEFISIFRKPSSIDIMARPEQVAKN